MGGEIREGMKTRCFRRLLVLAALGALQHLANAQAYRPMVVEGNRWGEYFFFESSSAYVYEIKGDSTINGIAYKKVLTNGNSLNQCSVILREDTTERKVYYYNAGGQEKLLYDFSLLPGEIDSLECGSVIVQIGRAHV